MSDLAKTIGERLRHYRVLNDMTQKDLAEKAELHQTYIGGVERGERNISIANLEKIIKALDLPPQDLFNLK